MAPGLSGRQGERSQILSLHVQLRANTRALSVRLEKACWREKESKIGRRGPCKAAQLSSALWTSPTARASPEHPRFTLTGDLEQLKSIEQLRAGRRLSLLKSRNQRGNFQNNLVCRNKSRVALNFSFVWFLFKMLAWQV